MESILCRPSTTSSSIKTPRIIRQKQSVSVPQNTKLISRSNSSQIPPLSTSTANSAVPLKLSFQSLLADVQDSLSPITASITFRAQFSSLITKFETCFNQFVQNVLMLNDNSFLSKDIFMQKFTPFFRLWKSFQQSCDILTSNGIEQIHNSIDTHFQSIFSSLKGIVGKSQWSKPTAVMSLENRAHSLQEESDRAFDPNLDYEQFQEKFSILGEKMIAFSKQINNGLSKEASHFQISPKEIVRLRSKAYSSCSDIMSSIKIAISFQEKSLNIDESLKDFEKSLLQFLSPYPSFEVFFDKSKPNSRMSAVPPNTLEITTTTNEFHFDDSLELVPFLESAVSFFKCAISSSSIDQIHSQLYQQQITFLEAAIKKSKGIEMNHEKTIKKIECRCKQKSVEIEECYEHSKQLQNEILIKEKTIQKLNHDLEKEIIKFQDLQKDIQNFRDLIIMPFLEKEKEHHENDIKNIIEEDDNQKFIQKFFNMIIQHNNELLKNNQILTDKIKNFQAENGNIDSNIAKTKNLIQELEMKINQSDLELSRLIKIYSCDNQTIKPEDNKVTILEKEIKAKINELEKEKYIESQSKTEIINKLIEKLGCYTQFIHPPISQEELVFYSVDNLLKKLESIDNQYSNKIQFEKNVCQVLNPGTLIEIDEESIIEQIRELTKFREGHMINQKNVQEGEKQIKELRSKMDQMMNSLNLIEERLKKLTNGSAYKRGCDQITNIQNLLNVIEESITFTQNELKQLRLVSTEEVTKLKSIIHLVEPTTQIGAWTFTQYLEYLYQYLEKELQHKAKEEAEKDKKLKKEKERAELEKDKEIVMEKSSQKANKTNSFSSRKISVLCKEAFDIIAVTSREDPEKYLPEICAGLKNLNESILALKPFAQTLNSISLEFDCTLQSFQPSSKNYASIKEQFQALHSILGSLQPSKINSLVYLILSRFIALLSSLASILYSLSD